MEYEQYLNKPIKMQVDIAGNLLTYTCTILSLDNSHVTIKDRLDDIHTFRVQDVIQVSEIKRKQKEEED